MDNKVACPSCGKSVHKYSMNRHQEIHKGLTYDCTNCEKKFKTKYSLYDHSKTHKEVIEIKCSECGEIFKSKSVLKKHKLTTHKGVTYECIYCFKELDSKQYLGIHMKLCMQTIKCPECNKRLKSREVLERHMTLHQGHKCEICGKVYNTKILKQVHMSQYHNNNNEESKYCRFCKKLFSTSSNLMKHLKQIHQSDNPNKGYVKMSNGDNMFLSFDDKPVIELKETKVKVTDVISCDICNMTFKWKQNAKKTQESVQNF